MTYRCVCATIVILHMLIGTTENTRRVVRVHDDYDHSYVVLIALQKNARKIRRFCTGSLVSEAWVLSAAHCMQEKHCKRLKIVYKDFTVPLSQNEFTKNVQCCVHHNAFGKDTHINDIGLIKINVIKMQSFGKISAVDFKSLVGFGVLNYGFGSTAPRGLKDQKKLARIKEKDEIAPLQRGEAIVVKCGADESRTPAALICLRPKCDQNPAMNQLIGHGDSGGPLIFKGKIVGVATGGYSDSNYEFFYTAVSPYLDWMHDIISQHGTLP